MKLPFSPLSQIHSSHHSIQLLFNLKSTPSKILLQAPKSLTSLSSRNPSWNSNASFIITNPTLLIMESCNSMSHLKQVQAHMMRTGLIFHLFPISRIISFCALSDAGSIHHANALFTQITVPNTYIWNTMIRGYSKNQNPVMGLSFFRKMVEEGVEMDSRSFVFALKACEMLGAVGVGGLVHGLVWKLGFACDLLVENGLVHFYDVCGCLSFARHVFDEMSVRDVVSWTAMINGYVKNSMADEGLKVFYLMVSSSVEPNEVTMIAVLSACSHKGDLNLGKSIHEYVEIKRVNYSLNLKNAMLDMYVKCGCLITAREIFEKMETRDVFTWTTMINGFAKNGELDLARKYFDEMPLRNVVSWNAMIAGYSQNNQPKEALELFHRMEKARVVPIESTLVCVLSACSQLGCLDLGRWIHFYYVEQKRIRLSAILGNAFIDMYAKCGSINEAAHLFDEMQERDLVSWNSMIVACASHGLAEKALILFEQMKNMKYKPDDITFVGVLSACSHGGLLTQGREYFRNMEGTFGLKPKVEHYACMVDLLGRIGLLKEAYELIKEMPMQPDEAAWGALLNACRIYSNVELGKLAAEKLLTLDPTDSGIYAILASLCANKREWGDVRTVRSMMRERRIIKTPGRSSIEVEGEFHEFLAADESHLQSKGIYKVLNDIFYLSKLEDYASDATQSVHLHDGSLDVDCMVYT